MPNNQQQKRELRDDIKVYASLELVAKSEGGQNLLKSLRKGILTDLNKLTESCTTATHPELVAIAVSLKEKFNMVMSFERAPVNLTDAETILKDILKEERTGLIPEE